MKQINVLFILVLLFLTINLKAYNSEKRAKKTAKTNIVNPLDCAIGTSTYEMSINNVRALLLNNGDMWWNTRNGRYIVPKVDPNSGKPEVSAIFAAGIWVGGTDGAGNLKLTASPSEKFIPGPLDDFGQTDQNTCKNWDKHFVVKKKDVDLHIKNYNDAKAAGKPLDCNKIPISIKGWPAVDNPYFFEVNNFNLPFTKQGLASFFDVDFDGIYNPCNGDYPALGISGCNLNNTPDEFAFWIMNDNGKSFSFPIQMEFQVSAFAFNTNDALNDMTFQRYKIMNKSSENLFNTYFSLWVDADLGCSTDDYIGCDTTRNMMYVYNQDAIDGTSGCVCTPATPTFCDKIPILGIDFFKGPKSTVKTKSGVDSTIELGITSFTYYNNSGIGNPLPGSTDPITIIEYYNCMKGLWRDGTPLCYGGSGYPIGNCNKTTKFAFPDAPNKSNGWSMCTANLPFNDRRTIQSSGPFTMQPGAVNEVIFGLPFVANQVYPCPDITALQAADDLAQKLFDNCFNVAVDDINHETFDFELFPNPTASIINIIYQNVKIQTLMITDITGRLIKKVETNHTNDFQKLDVSLLNTGVYFIQIIDVDNKKAAKMFMKM
jgi:hypothetical protein